MAEILPAIFFGHGNPMNAVLENGYTKAWSRIGRTTPKPKAILSISAHWFVSETGVTIATSPRTIHDFGGFPRELFQVQYPAPGDPKLARRVQKLLAPLDVTLDNSPSNRQSPLWQAKTSAALELAGMFRQCTGSSAEMIQPCTPKQRKKESSAHFQPTITPPLHR